MLVTGIGLVVLRGFWSRIAIFLALIFGYAVSWLFDRLFGRVHGHWRLNLSGVDKADWFGLPSFHAPSFSRSAILVALPVVIVLTADNTGHVKAVGEMTGDPLDDQLGVAVAVAADGAATMPSAAVGGPATTTYSENIGVMAATRAASTGSGAHAAGAAAAGRGHVRVRRRVVARRIGPIPDQPLPGCGAMSCSPITFSSRRRS